MAAEPATTRPAVPSSVVPAFFRDVRVLHFVGQLVFAVVLIIAFAAIWTAIVGSLEAKNLAPNLDFLANRAGFDISEHPAWYSSSSSYGEAFRVGLENTLRIISIGLVLTTILGILGGIALLSSNWLVRTVSRSVVELLRNTPLLVQLIAWYFVGMLSLPLFQNAIGIPQEGVVPVPARLLVYLAAVIVVWLLARTAPRGSPRRTLLWNGLIAAIIAIELAFHWWAVDLYRSARLDNPVFLLYMAISVGVVVGIWVAVKKAQRWRLLGLAGGQLIGGLLFYFGIIPSTTLGRIEVYPAVLLSKRGLVFPEILRTDRFNGWLAIVVIGGVVAGLLWAYLRNVTERTERPIRRNLYAVILFVGIMVVGWIVVSAPPAPATIPIVQKDGTTADMTMQAARAAGLLTRLVEQEYSQSPILYIPPAQKISPAGIVSGLASGTPLTPEYMALLLGLVVYTASFIAEIVRAGIMSVPHGQIEAARALGLSTAQTLSIIIMPQALRVIIPPLGNQYLNLAKNSSLAIAVAYADLVLVTQTIMNQSGQSVTGITMIMVTYLIISLIIAAIINLVYRRYRIVTR